MQSWPDVERRSVPTVTRDEFTQFVQSSSQQRHELRDMVRDVQGTLVEMRRDLKCIHETWDTHVDEYGDLLKSVKRDRVDREKLRSAILEKSLTGAVWAMVVIVAVSLWDSFKSNLK